MDALPARSSFSKDCGYRLGVLFGLGHAFRGLVADGERSLIGRWMPFAYGSWGAVWRAFGRDEFEVSH